MTAWTAQALPPELVAILDGQAGRAHSPDGAVRRCLADILNAYDAMLADAAGPEPCPYRGPRGIGPRCRLDAREHYHYAQHPSGREVVVRYGSDEDKRAFPPYGRRG